MSTLIGEEPKETRTVENVSGVAFNDGRVVAVGRISEAPEVYVLFVSEEGEKTEFRLSNQAAKALHLLLTDVHEVISADLTLATYVSDWPIEPEHKD